MVDGLLLTVFLAVPPTPAERARGPLLGMIGSGIVVADLVFTFD